jgi:hypothetical protein
MWTAITLPLNLLQHAHSIITPAAKILQLLDNHAKSGEIQ